VPSLIDNLVTALYGKIQKDVFSGKVVWNIPCDPSTSPATIWNFPREQGEGVLCYILRFLNFFNDGHVTFYGTFDGDLIGNVTGNLVGNVTGSVTGNATTATTLQNSRTIAASGDVTGIATPFDGSNNISVPTTINNGAITPIKLSTGKPIWDTSGNTTILGNIIAVRGFFYGNGAITSNSALGTNSLLSNTTGTNNIAIGESTLFSNTTGSGNSAIGQSALLTNSNGFQNTANGALALIGNTTGSNNTAIGSGSLKVNTTGSSNVAIGNNAGQALTTGSNNTIIGSGIDGSAGLSNTLIIGAGLVERMRFDSSGNCGIGTSTITARLTVNGAITSNNTITATTFSGSLSGNATTAGTATNLAGTTANQIPYQSASGTTSYISAGTIGKMLTQGASAPQWSTDHLGTTTNDNATAGYVGEFVTSTVDVGSAVALTSGVTANVASISLTAGDWDVRGQIDYRAGATTSITILKQGANTTSATLGSQDTYTTNVFADVIPTAVNDIGNAFGQQRISIASTTTVYLVASATFTLSTLSAYGTISARRVR
jgi:hypothetical protein